MWHRKWLHYRRNKADAIYVLFSPIIYWNYINAKQNRHLTVFRHVVSRFWFWNSTKNYIGLCWSFNPLLVIKIRKVTVIAANIATAASQHPVRLSVNDCKKKMYKTSISTVSLSYRKLYVTYLEKFLIIA